MCLQFGFVIFWLKDFGAKAVHKMLVKLTPGWHGTGQNKTEVNDTRLVKIQSYFMNSKGKLVQGMLKGEVLLYH